MKSCRDCQEAEKTRQQVIPQQLITTTDPQTTDHNYPQTQKVEKLSMCTNLCTRQEGFNQSLTRIAVHMY